jgi:hypothetical protein
VEEFERAINTRDANINNLDLNNDNHVDYISVLSYDQQAILLYCIACSGE